jgi:hypothetical protein
VSVLRRIPRLRRVPAPDLHSEALLKNLAKVADRYYALNVWQWLPGHVGNHAPGSLHEQAFPDGVGKAFDAYTDMVPESRRARMGAFAHYCAHNYGDRLTELIYNGSHVKVGVKYGRVMWGDHANREFWGSETWDAHANHVHVGNL